MNEILPRHKVNNYLNATEISKRYNKKFSDWRKTKAANILIEKCFLETNDELILINYTNKKKDDRSTYIHFLLETEFLIWLQNYRREVPTNGIIYILNDESWSNVKIGRWTSDLPTLYSRYSTVFPFLSFDYYETNDAAKSETTIHKELKSYRVSGEVYPKIYINTYHSVIQDICKSKKGNYSKKLSTLKIP